MHKVLLLILGIVMVLTILAARGLNITHWEETEWDVDSYDPIVPILSLVGGICYCGVIFLTAKGNLWLWIMGVSWVGFALILVWAMYFI